MDLSNSETIASSPSDVLMRYESNNAPFRSTYHQQAFPFRHTLIRYITNNPVSSKLYQKMIQTCKHFFIKNPIIVVPKLSFYRTNGWYTLGSLLLKDRPYCKSVYLYELTSKIWITDSLDVFGSTPNYPTVTSLMPKIYQCGATSIIIDGHMFSFNDLIVIASKCKILRLSNVVIMNNDEIVCETEECQFSFETAVSLEVLFKTIPSVKFFEYRLPKNSLNIITTKTVADFLKISHFLSLNEFVIIGIPEFFDIKSFYSHIKENKKTKIQLIFSDQLSDEYKTQLQTIVDEIRETENRDYKVPRIVF